MSKKLEGLRGMPDVLPKQALYWQAFEVKWRKLIEMYGYEEIRLPILENTALFSRSIGTATDIVEKEMFSFQSKDDKESLTLRPEGTAGCVRAGIEHGLLYHQIQRLWYGGPMFRYERPQKGRYRQFHQIGVEAFGLEGPDIEVEHILMIARLWRELGVTDLITLEVNSIGSLESRKNYQKVLVDYFSKHIADLDADSQRRLHTNPLRILDSKNPAMAEMIQNAPKGQAYLDAESSAHFELFLQKLTALGIPYRINPNLVRGLDYYNRTVYEWVTEHLGSQGAVCAGGRYDALVEELGGHKTPAVGFAIGIERVLLLQQVAGLNYEAGIDVYVIHAGDKTETMAVLLAEALRDEDLSLRLVVHAGGGQFKQQFKQADKSGAKLALILGETEVEQGVVGVKFLRESREQLVVSKAEVKQFIRDYLSEERGVLS